VTHPTCATCTEPDPTGGYVCASCVRSVADLLVTVADLGPALHATIARQRGRGLGGGARSRDRPLPVDLAAAEKDAVASGVLTTWARHVLEARPGSGVWLREVVGPTCSSGGCTHRTCAAIRANGGLDREHPAALSALVLAGELEWLRRRSEAAEALDDLGVACRELVRLVDIPPESVYAGPCWADVQIGADLVQCQAELYARLGADVVRCPACRADHAVAERREWLLGQVYDVLATAATIAGAMTSLVRPVTVDMIDGWERRTRLHVRGHDRDGRRLFRVGDVAAILAERHAKAAGKAA
jgi:hypothetical protein